MKRLIYVLFLTLLGLNACTTQSKSEYVIGKISKGGIVLTQNVDKVQEHWKKVLEIQNNPQSIVDVEIISATNEENSEIYYLITGQNSTHTFKIATEVYSDGDQIYFKESPAAAAGTVTCSGCKDGCNPGKSGNDYYCDDGCGSNCTKSVTVTTK